MQQKISDFHEIVEIFSISPRLKVKIQTLFTLLNTIRSQASSQKQNSIKYIKSRAGIKSTRRYGKMRKGENIFKRKDGRWEARYIKGYELSGKIKYGFCYGKTYKEAKEKVSKHKAALLAGKPTPQTGTRHRFAFYCDEWLRLRKSTIR